MSNISIFSNLITNASDELFDAILSVMSPHRLVAEYCCIVDRFKNGALGCLLQKTFQNDDDWILKYHTALEMQYAQWDEENRKWLSVINESVCQIFCLHAVDDDRQLRPLPLTSMDLNNLLADIYVRAFGELSILACGTGGLNEIKNHRFNFDGMVPQSIVNEYQGCVQNCTKSVAEPFFTAKIHPCLHKLRMGFDNARKSMANIIMDEFHRVCSGEEFIN